MSLDSKKVRDLLKLAKLASGRNKIQIQAVWLKASILNCYEIQTP